MAPFAFLNRQNTSHVLWSLTSCDSLTVVCAS